MGIKTGGGGGGGQGVGGAGRTLIWEWNGTDTTQFEGTAAYADGSGAGSLSIQAITDHGNALRFAGSAGTTAHLAFLAVDPIVFSTERRDLLFEIELHDMVQGTGGYFGIAMCADDVGDYHALNHLAFGTAEWSSRIETAGRVNGGTGATISTDGGFARIVTRGRKPSAAAPQLSSYLSGWSGSDAGGTEPKRTGNNRGGMLPIGDNTALPATWDNLACDRWGLCLQSSGGNALPTSVDILSLRVFDEA